MTSMACPAKPACTCTASPSCASRCPFRARRGRRRDRNHRRSAGSRPSSAAGVPPKSARSGRTWRPIIDCSETWPCGSRCCPWSSARSSDSEEELRDILRRNHEALVALLARLRGKVEMGLKVYWDLPNVFEYFVATHQELESMRNRLFHPGRDSTVEEKVELGKLFGTCSSRPASGTRAGSWRRLASCCSEVRSIDPGRGADDYEAGLPGGERPPSRDGKKACGRPPACSTRTIVSTTAAPGRRTTSSMLISALAVGGPACGKLKGARQCSSWTTFCWPRMKGLRNPVPEGPRSGAGGPRTPGEGDPGGPGRIAPTVGVGPHRRGRVRPARERCSWIGWKLVQNAAHPESGPA